MAKNKTGFTLLEVIIVIIIVSVLAALAMPRFFRMIERTRAVEAINQLQAFRSAVERCYLMSNKPFFIYECIESAFAAGDVPPAAHFTYDYTHCTLLGSAGFALIAIRNTLDLGIAPQQCSFDVTIAVTDGACMTPYSPTTAGAVVLVHSYYAGTSVTGYCAYEGI